MNVACYTLSGEIRQIPVGAVVFRPAAYGLIIQDGHLLLLRIRQTGKYVFPGGGLEIGEHVEDALFREVQEETGLEVTIGSLALVADYCFHYDPANEAYHCIGLFYH